MTTTSMTTKKTTTQLLEDVVTERELTDIEFLEEIVRDLDAGWTTGAMCDDTGKCLVGAGAAALGLDYGAVHYSYNALQNGKIDRVSNRVFISEFDEKVRAMEFKSAARLLDLIGPYIGYTINYDSLTQSDIIKLMTEFNDSVVSGYPQLRKVLTDKIEELRA